ncbi:MAG: ATP-dependent metallopeptidase FtsH/Yme1/Tma family protein [Caldilineaceae bacterium]
MTAMRPQEQGSSSNNSSTTPPVNNGIQIIQWVLFVVLLFWTLSIFWPTQGQSVELPYSSFLHQVQIDNVKQVDITGSDINGSFAKNVVWPPATATAGADQQAPAPTPTAPAAPSLFASGQPTSTTYTDFTTHFPTDVGDPNLLPLLESHGVLVDVTPPPTPWAGAALDRWFAHFAADSLFWLYGAQYDAAAVERLWPWRSRA